MVTPKVVFDLRRTTTAVSSRGRVHITSVSGLETLCGLDLAERHLTWTENLDNRQPDCDWCVRRAVELPHRYSFVATA